MKCRAKGLAVLVLPLVVPVAPPVAPVEEGGGEIWLAGFRHWQIPLDHIIPQQGSRYFEDSDCVFFGYRKRHIPELLGPFECC